MSSLSFSLPDDVRARLETLGAAGAAWLEGLGDAVDRLSRAWDVRVGGVLTGGSESLVLEAVRGDGSPAIVKLRMPGADEMTSEVEALRLADGRGYARLFAYDADADALLLERLGAPLAGRGLAFETELGVLAATVRAGWTPVPAGHGLPTAADKADWLRGFIAETNAELGEPCGKAVIDRALGLAEERRAAFDAATCVLVHGDPHAFNALAEPDGGDGYRFIDPDGLCAEPAYDLGVLLREGNAELLAEDPLRLGRSWCEHLAAESGVDPDAVWQWAFVERVSTGLMLLKIGMDGEGRETLAVAEAWAE